MNKWSIGPMGHILEYWDFCWLLDILFIYVDTHHDRNDQCRKEPLLTNWVGDVWHCTDETYHSNASTCSSPRTRSSSSSSMESVSGSNITLRPQMAFFMMDIIYFYSLCCHSITIRQHMSYSLQEVNHQCCERSHLASFQMPGKICVPWWCQAWYQPCERNRNQNGQSLPPSVASWMHDFNGKTLSVPIKSVW